MPKVTIIIVKEDTEKMQWFNAWQNKEFVLVKSWPHTDTHFCVMQLPKGENEEAPEGFQTVPRDKCYVWYYPCDKKCLEMEAIGHDTDICKDGCVQATPWTNEQVNTYLKS